MKYTDDFKVQLLCFILKYLLFCWYFIIQKQKTVLMPSNKILSLTSFSAHNFVIFNLKFSYKITEKSITVENDQVQ